MSLYACCFGGFTNMLPCPSFTSLVKSWNKQADFWKDVECWWLSKDVSCATAQMCVKPWRANYACCFYILYHPVFFSVVTLWHVCLYAVYSAYMYNQESSRLVVPASNFSLISYRRQKPTDCETNLIRTGLYHGGFDWEGQEVGGLRVVEKLWNIFSCKWSSNGSFL